MAGPAVEPASTGPVRVLGVLVPRWAWLLVCVAGIYTCFLSWGILQERVSTRKYQTEGHSEVFGSFIVLNAVQACVATLWALAYGWMRGHPVRRPTRSTALGYLQLGAAASFGAYCGYRSLGYITFPLVILSKSCKLVPVMLVQTIMDRKIYPWQKYLSVTVVTIGVAWFTWLKPGKGDGGGGGGDGDGHGLAWVGLLLVGLNLLLDGFVNAKEGRMFRTEHMTAHDLQLFMNLAQAAIMIVYLVINPVGDNELADAVGFITRHPAALNDILLFAIAGSLGQTFVFLTLESFGSIVLVTITVTRKIFTIVLSVFWFGHNISLGQWLAVAMVFAGIFLESFGERVFPPKTAAAAVAAPSATVQRPGTPAASAPISPAGSPGSKLTRRSSKAT